MKQKILQYFWSLRAQFMRYFVVGFSGLFLDMGTLILFTELFGWNPVLSVVVNQAIALTYNFLLNKYWSFKNKEMPYTQVVRYIVLAGFNYGFSVLIMYIFSERMGYDYRLVRLGTIALMVAWNFFLYKYWVYRDMTQDADNRTQ